MSAALPEREVVARLIRTYRLKAEGVSPMEIMFSPDAPADDCDLLLADAAIVYLDKVRAELGQP